MTQKITAPETLSKTQERILYGEARAARGVKASTIYGESARLSIFAAWLLRCRVMDIHAFAPGSVEGQV